MNDTITLTVTATINRSELDKVNTARKALGQQPRSAADVVQERVCDALAGPSIATYLVAEEQAPAFRVLVM